MTRIAQLPPDLVKRYKAWQGSVFRKKAVHYETLAREGQSPSVMVISCCDSRVHVTEIFGANTGDFFVHRNIANLVPPYQPDGDYHGTSAAVEYGVRALKVRHLMVVGHSQCGGVQACYDMCAQGSHQGGHGVDAEQQGVGQQGVAQQEAEQQTDYQFVGRWLEMLRPAYEPVISAGDDDRIIDLHVIDQSMIDQSMIEMGQRGIVGSLNNLKGFPFIEKAVAGGDLSLHGLWHDIGSGTLYELNPTRSHFEAI